MHNENILIVDDTPKNIQVLGSLLKDKNYNLSIATSGEQALSALSNINPDLILMDVMMPGLDGYETCKKIKENSDLQNIPLIFLTAKGETEDIVKGFQVGGADYVQKPFQAEELLARIQTHLEMKKMRDHLDVLVEERTTALKEALSEVELMKLEIVRRLGRAAEYRDNETGMHVQRMSHYSLLLAKACNAPEDLLNSIQEASMMHDIGKIGIPDKILLKPGKLTPEEFEEMKKHSQIGAELLSGIETPFFQISRNIALFHHEKYNGAGYPSGLKGKEIPLEARIVAISDVFDALTSQRPYKEAWPDEKAFQFIENEKGTHFDPELADLFLSMKKEILEIKSTLHD